ncbi:hypothetical protein ONZ43_g5190 [Nemania bipapillata]|uniref:Uncharacterized protein n=1 Tax=Nemania bipapillata TaxID=110536 RepID=A0ACC2IDP2_9PEZI|nr:hypothetical protein ONZ43_g5190 [Nemania bipapillata]
MPSSEPDDAVPTGTTAKRPAKKSARSEGAELTPAQKQKEERRETLQRIKQRQALCREAPSELVDNSFISEETLVIRKRPAYPSYDESHDRREKVGHGPKAKKRARRVPWVKDPGLEKPFSPPDPPVGTSPRDLDPIHAAGKFGKLPTELRDQILRYLLVWPHDIPVLYSWERAYPRSRPRLDLSIMYTCRVLRDQGLKILFGENRFEYDVRDPVASHDHTSPVLEKVFGNTVVPINEHGHLIRHIKIKVDRSRIHFNDHRQKFDNSILKFLPGGGLAHKSNLYTVTLEVPAVRNYDVDSLRKPDKVPIGRYLQQDSRFINALFKLRVQWVRVLAWDLYEECWETKVDMRDYVKMVANKKKGSTAEGANGIGILGDPVDAAGCITNDTGVMGKLVKSRAKQAMAGLQNLAQRIEDLADASETGAQPEFWTKSAGKEVSGPEIGNDLDTLLKHWREPSFGTCTRSSRSRTTTRSIPDIGPSTVTPMLSGIEAMPTAAEPGPSNILQARDAEKDAKLLQAQHPIQENESELDEGGMLTEESLESLSR